MTQAELSNKHWETKAILSFMTMTREAPAAAYAWVTGSTGPPDSNTAPQASTPGSPNTFHTPAPAFTWV